MSKYIITALRNVVVVCDNKKDVFIGNTDIKLFDSKQQAKDFMKTKKFKNLDKICPCVWNITEVEVKNMEKENEKK